MDVLIKKIRNIKWKLSGHFNRNRSQVTESRVVVRQDESDLEKEKLEMELQQTKRKECGISVYTQTDLHVKKFDETEGLKTERDSEIGATKKQLKLVKRPSNTSTAGFQANVPMSQENTDISQFTKPRYKIHRLGNGPVEMGKCTRKYESVLHSHREEAKEQIINNLESKACVHLQKTMPNKSNLEARVDTWKKKPKIDGDEKFPVRQTMNQEGSSATQKSGCHEKHIQARFDRMSHAQAADKKLESSITATRGMRRAQQAGTKIILLFPIPDYSNVQARVDTWRKKPKIHGEEKSPVRRTMNHQGSSATPKTGCHEKHIHARVDRISYAQADDMKLESSIRATRVMSRDQNAGRKGILHFPIPDYSNLQPRVDTWRKKPKIDGDEKFPVRQAINQQGSSLTQKSGCHEKHTQARVDRMPCAQAADMKLESCITATRGMRRDQKTGRKGILHFPIPDYSNLQPRVDTWRKKPIIDGDEKFPVRQATNQQGSSPTQKSDCHEKHTQARVDRMSHAQAADKKLVSSITATRGMRRDQQAGKKGILHFPIPDYSNLHPRVDTWRKKPKIDGDEKFPVRQALNQQGSSPTQKSGCHEEHILSRVDQMSHAQAADKKLVSSITATRGMKRDQQAGKKGILHFPIPDYSNIQARVSTWRGKPKIGGVG
jgi:hypothetical protein